MNRSKRKAQAEETVALLQAGYYGANGQIVDLRPQLDRMLTGTKLFRPEELKQLRSQVLLQRCSSTATRIDVVNETTLEGLRGIVTETGDSIAVLNFASAKNPGGGFLSGSEAQEESLARSSGLYASLQAVFEFYEIHRGMSSCLYTDHMIWTPDCPVFRDEDGELSAQSLSATFITSPAPNAGAIADNSPHELPKIESVLRTRAEFVLTLAAAHGYRNLILGAWGCGVFRNEPSIVARVFADHLRGEWQNRFDRVRFSVLDRSPDQRTLTAFQNAFAN